MKDFNSMEKTIIRRMVALSRENGTVTFDALLREIPDFSSVATEINWRIRIRPDAAAVIEIERSQQKQLFSERDESGLRALLDGLEEQLFMLIRLIQYLELSGDLQFAGETPVEVMGPPLKGETVACELTRTGLSRLAGEYGRKQMSVSDRLTRLIEHDFRTAAEVALQQQATETARLLKWVIATAALATLSLAATLITHLATDRTVEAPPTITVAADTAALNALTAEVAALKEALKIQPPAPPTAIADKGALDALIAEVTALKEAVKTRPQPVPAGAAAPAVHPTTASRLMMVNADILNVRERPGLESRIIGKLYNAETVGLLQQLDGWYLVEKHSGARVTVQGWVSGDYLRE